MPTPTKATRIAQLHAEKKKHLKEYEEYIQMIAKNHPDFVFNQGTCEVCERIDRELKELGG